MSDEFKLPELPSDEELGIDDEDLAEYMDDEGSELSEAEMKALLGDSPPPRAAPSGKTAKTPKAKKQKAKKQKAGKPGTGTKGAGWRFWQRKPKEAGSGGKGASPAAKPGPAGGEKAGGAAGGGPAPQGGSPGASAPPAGTPEGGGATPPGDAPPPPKAKAVKEPEGPRTGWRGPVTLVLLLLSAWLGSTARAVPDPVPANAPDTAFSSARAMSHVVEIARGAHPPGSPEHDRVRAYLMDELRDLGLEPEVQTVTSMLGRAGYVRAVTARNIVARLPGTASTGALLVTAHYDGRGLARAAGDDGAGVVSILESLRALRAGEPLRNDLIVLITDAEELGLLGARGFVDGHPWIADVQAVISVEMRGGGGPSIMFETGGEYGWIMQQYKDGAPRPFANSLTYEIYRRMPNDTDFTPFREAGKQGLNFAAIGRAHVYHQVYDSPEHLSEGTLQHHGSNTLSMIRTLGATDLARVSAPDVTYFTVPFVGLVTYPQGWTWPITAVVLLAWVGVLILARVRGLGLAGAVAGFLIPVLSGGAAYAAGTFGVRWLERFHPELGSLHGSAFHSEGWYVLALAAVTFTIMTGLWGLARTRFGFREMAVGASPLIVPLVLLPSYFVPLGAMNLQWPALAFLMAVGAALVIPAAGRVREARWLVAVLGAAVVLGLLTSMTELLWLAMSIRMAGPLGVLIAVILLLVLPALDSLREPNAWFAPALGTVLAAAFLGVGILQAGPSPQRPLPSTLIYALDTETGVARWATAPSQGDEDPARAWAAAQASVTFGSQESLEPFTGSDRLYAVAPAPVIAAPRPTVAMEGSVIREGLRLVRVSVRSTLSAEVLRFELPAGVNVFAVNGKGVPEVDDVRVVEHWGRPDSAVTLDLGVAAGDSAVAFTLVEQSLRPGELLGAEVFRRPPDQAPDIVRESDRALIRTPVSFELQPAPAAGPDGPPATEDPAVAAPPPAASGDSIAAPDTTLARDTVPSVTGTAALRP